MTEYVVESSAEIVLGLNEKKPIRVLHVDDELGLLKVAKQCLEMQGPFQVDTASSVEEALEKLKKEKYDAVVSDYLMPGKDGLEFLKELRGKGNRTPFIMFTGKGREEVAIRALNLGANQYLNKTGEPETVYTELAHSITELAKARKAEQELLDSEERFRNLFENANDGLVFVDLSGRIMDINQKLVHMAERTKEDVVGKSFLELGLISSKDVPALVDRLRQNAMGKPTESFEFEIGEENSEKKPIEINSVLIRKENMPLGSLVIVRDITERKKKEEALRESEEKYRNLFESAMDAIVTLDLKGSITAVNSSVLRFGYKKEDLVGKNILDFVSKEYWPAVIRDLSKVAQGEPAKNEVELAVPTGKILVEYHAGAIVKENNVAGVQINIRDVTERKKSEELLRESEERFRGLFEGIQDPVGIFVGSEGRLLDYNPAFKKLFGYRDEELKDKAYLDFVHPDDHAMVLEKYQTKYSEEELPLIYEIRGVNKKGETIHLELTVGTHKVRGRVIGIEVMFRNITERKMLEEELKESEERHRNLYESVPDALAVYVGREGRLIEYNKAFKKHFGFTDEELKDKTFLGFVHPDDRAMVLEKYRTEYPEEKLPLVYEIRGVSKKGEVIPIEISVGPFKKNGRVIGINVMHRDITKRKRMEEELRDSEERFRGLYESIQDPVGIFVGREGRLIDYNAAFKKSSGYTDEELKGKVFLDFVHPDDHAMVLEKYQTKYSEEELPLVYEIRGMSKKGESIPLELSVSTYKEKGKVIGIEVIHRDLTERKKAEMSLRESQGRFEGLFQGNPEAAAYLGPDYRIQDVNPRFEKLFGYSLEEVNGKHINDVVVPDDRREEGETLDRDARKGYVYRNTVRRKKDGSLVQVSVSAAPIANESGVTGIVAMYKDISDLKNAEKRMDVMNEKLRVVGGLTRHDIRNKLTAVAGNAYLLRKRLADDPDATECLNGVEAAVRESERIFDFASAYEKLGVEQLAYVDAKKILDEAVTLFPDLKGVKIVNECGGLTVLADSLLRQLFYNLIDDSLKYGEKLTQIRIRYERSENQLKLVYEDDGVGISRDAKSKLFTEGFTTGKGSGYGLYLIGRMMEVYGWTINETGTHGKGAQFTINIPKAKPDGRPNYKLG
jgi:PAS domain S-box-containing protein